MAFEPGLCSACGAELEEEDPLEVDESLEGWPCRAGFAPDQTVVTKDAQAKLHREIEELTAGGRRCPKCGMSMIHSRLTGYECPRRCP